VSDDAEVILFPRPYDDAVKPPAEKPDYVFGGCYHRLYGARLDVEAKRLYCGGCGVEINAFDWIEWYIEQWKHQNTRYRQAKQQADETEKRLASLQRLERNARARVRRVGVALSARDARSIRDQLRAASRTIDRLFMRLGGDADTQATVLAELERAGVDRSDYARVLSLLDTYVELRPRDEGDPE
jgi:hypothetical protein